MEDPNIPLVIHFNEGVDLLPFLLIPLDELICPLDHVKTDGTEGGQCTPLLLRLGKDSSRGRQGHDIILRQGKCGTATCPVGKLL